MSQWNKRVGRSQTFTWLPRQTVGVEGPETNGKTGEFNQAVKSWAELLFAVADNPELRTEKRIWGWAAPRTLASLKRLNPKRQGQTRPPTRPSRTMN